jgi:hypothetical protein
LLDADKNGLSSTSCVLKSFMFAVENITMRTMKVASKALTRISLSYASSTIIDAVTVLSPKIRMATQLPSKIAIALSTDAP